jgi:xylan 1,4-beta-xylosidase
MNIRSSFVFVFLIITSNAVLFTAASGRQRSTAPSRTISADFNNIKGKHDTFFRHTVGAGRAAEGLRADWQRDLALVHRECGFKYIRFHGLLQDELGVYSEDRQGRAHYNFQYIDAIYDAILNTGMRPFVEFGFMPGSLASGTKSIFWWKGLVTPPRDYARWSQLIEALVRHWTERYGAEEVRQWLFEVWNEPNLDGFWAADQAEYFKLYRATVSAVKNVSPDYRVGGPATAGNAWVPETIAFAKQNSLALDFITTHDYGVRGGGLDEFGVQKLFLDASDLAIIGSVRRVRSQIKESAVPDLPLYYTEWSTSYSPRDPVHDAYISAPYILSRLKGCEGSAQAMSYWTFTDIFEESGPVPNPFHGGFGLINFQGLRKPAFYAYQFLNRLGDDELTSGDPNSWVCRSKDGAQVLFWNYTPPKTDESDQVHYKRDLPAADAGTARVSIKGLPSGGYEMNIYKIGYQANDVYTDYFKMGSPASLTREQVRQLAERNDGRPVTTQPVRIAGDGLFTREFPIRENDVYLVTLTRQ